MAEEKENFNYIDNEDFSKRVEIYDDIKQRYENFMKENFPEWRNEQNNDKMRNEINFFVNSNKNALHNIYEQYVKNGTFQDFNKVVNEYEKFFLRSKKLILEHKMQMNREVNNDEVNENNEKVVNVQERQSIKVLTENIQGSKEKTVEEINQSNEDSNNSEEKEKIYQEENNTKAVDEKTKKLSELLKELVSIQSHLTILRAQRIIKNLDEAVKKKIFDMNDYLCTEAIRYGQNKKEFQEILDEYKNQLYKAESEHKSYISMLKNIKGKYEAEEIRYIGKLHEKENEKQLYMQNDEYTDYKSEYEQKERSVKEDIGKGNFESAQITLDELKHMRTHSKISEFDKEILDIKSKIEEYRELINDYRVRIDMSTKYFESKIEGIEKNKGNGLKRIEKQKMINKLLGFIYKKVGGKKKFREHVIKPVKEKIDHMSESMGQTANTSKEIFTGVIIGIAQGTQTRKNYIINNIRGKVIDATQKAQEKVNNYQNVKEIYSEEGVHQR